MGYIILCNLIIVKISNLIIKIWGEELHFGAEQINKVYRLPDADIREYRAKIFDPRRWLAAQLFPGREVLWAARKKGITSNEFTVEVQIWLTIIFNGVSPTTNMTHVLIIQA